MRGILLSDIHHGYSGKANIINERFIKRVSKEEFDFMIIAGDLQSDTHSQFEDLAILLRKYIMEPIYFVYGNHDYWDLPRAGVRLSGLDRWYNEVHDYKNRVCDKYNLHYLQGNPVELDGVTILGFDGWYTYANPPTNDAEYMPTVYDVIPMNLYLSNIASKHLYDILDYKTSGKVVIVSHFPSFMDKVVNKFYPQKVDMMANLRWMEEIEKKADVYCVGHTHSKYREEHNGCLYLNCGSDYGNPKWKFFDI